MAAVAPTRERDLMKCLVYNRMVVAAHLMLLPLKAMNQLPLYFLPTLYRLSFYKCCFFAKARAA
jgi:hypothetical protein